MRCTLLRYMKGIMRCRYMKGIMRCRLCRYMWEINLEGINKLQAIRGYWRDT